MTKADRQKYTRRYYVVSNIASRRYEVRKRRKWEKLSGIGTFYYATEQEAQDEADKLNNL